MVIRELINKSVYGSIGYISSVNDINSFEQYLMHNLPILNEFKQVIIAIN